MRGAGPAILRSSARECLRAFDCAPLAQPGSPRHPRNSRVPREISGLARPMLRFCCLGSGSEGNALVVESRDGLFATRVLVDNGFKPKQLAARLARAGLALDDIDAVFVTHEHSDHADGVAALLERRSIPLFATRGTAIAARLDSAGADLRLLRAGVAVELGALRIEPFAVPHDAGEPVQFVFDDGARRFGLLT
ncbi:MAG: MBL fold metallo-hydrolase, partial [Pseudomonadota bacterium]